MNSTFDYDYALREIRRNMHDPRGSKAALMVGAGFSRNANSIRGSRQTTFPDWAALTKILVERLYTDATERTNVLESAGATSSALRLAQEFEAAHGRAALVDVVREAVPDDDFVPSNLHEELMDLNWADVFTTNYDTLLERSTLQQSKEKLRMQRYEVVFNASDLPLARRPRIVKLHGTLPDLSNLILTEDDYRRFPIDHAPFVNAVRASLTENILCLFGFSGNDPNFLAWTGWVRDVLEKSCPPIYLFNRLPPKPFQRKLLEERGIIPIPICEISGHADFADAFAWLFRELAKPLEEPTANWNLGPHFVESDDDSDSLCIHEPFSAKDPKKDSLMDAAILWRQHRLQYKGWHVLYRLGVTRLWTSTRFWLRGIDRKVVEDWEPCECVIVLRELVWRYARSLQPLPDDLVEYVIDPALERFTDWRNANKHASVRITGGTDAVSIESSELNDAYLRILLELLRHAREIGDSSRFDLIGAKVEEIFDSESLRMNRDERQFVEHQSVLWKLARLEHDHARSMLRRWNTHDADDAWTIRRAGLMLECGQRERGVLLLTKVLNRLSTTRSGTEIDYALRSAEGLALHLLWYCAKLETLGKPQEQRPVSKVPKVSPDSQFEVDAEELGGRDVRLPTTFEAELQVSDKSQQAVPEEAAIRRRLRELGELGCDPYELLDWLRLQNEDRLPPRQGVEERESFDAGQITRTTHSGNPEPFWNAYRAIRFIEEAGLPLVIHDVMGINVSGTLYRNAAQVIAVGTASEGIGLVLRSRDTKLIESFLSRQTLIALTPGQLHLLTDVGLATLRTATQELGVPPETREAKDEWWEKQLECAVTILSRIVVRLEAVAVHEIVTEGIALASDKHMWSRVSVASQLATLIRRSVESLRGNSLAIFLPELLRVPVPGSTPFPDSFDRLRRWYDPVVALDRRRNDTEYPTGHEIDELVATLLRDIRTATGKYRQRLVLRAVTLLGAGLLIKQQQIEFTDALFAQTDDFEFPIDTGCYDSLVLGLPRRPAVSEKSPFRRKYIEDAQPDDEYWENLRRTVSWFGPPRDSKARSIRWSRAELTGILETAEAWLPKLESRVAEVRDQSTQRHSFSSSLAENRNRAVTSAYESWLEVIEDVILLASNATDDHISRAVALLDRVGESGLERVKAAPTLVCLGRLQSAEAISSIIQAMGNREHSVVWQGCCGILRWCELTRARYQPAIPDPLLAAFGTMVVERRHERLTLLLNTAEDVIEILGLSACGNFVDQVMLALRCLRSETSYDSPVANFEVGRKISLRAACATLATRLRDLGVDSDAVQEWIDISRNDIFSEVRRSG